MSVSHAIEIYEGRSVVVSCFYFGIPLLARSMIYLVFPPAHFVLRVVFTFGSADSEHICFYDVFNRSAGIWDKLINRYLLVLFREAFSGSIALVHLHLARDVFSQEALVASADYMVSPEVTGMTSTTGWKWCNAIGRPKRRLRQSARRPKKRRRLLSRRER